MKKIHWAALAIFSCMVGASTFYLVNDFVRERSKDKIVTVEPSEELPIEKAEVIVEPPREFSIELPTDKTPTEANPSAEEENYEYIVGVLDGYITVFYREDVSDDNIKEITEIPANALSQDEQGNLRRGIKIKNDLELMRVMEDYGS